MTKRERFAWILVVAVFVSAGVWGLNRRTLQKTAWTFTAPQTFASNIVLGTTTMSVSGNTITFDTPSASTITYDFTNSGAGSAEVRMPQLDMPATATPTSTFNDSDDAGTVDGSIFLNCPTTDDCTLSLAVDAGSDTETVVLRLTGVGADQAVLQYITHATAPTNCAIGDFYVDTSGGYCACSATDTWLNMHGTGACT